MMTTVDATERSVVSRVPIAPEGPSARSQDVFSAIFESARQAGQSRAEASIRREQTTLLRSRLEDTDGAGRKRINELEEADRRQRQHEPGRADRLREQQHRQDAVEADTRSESLRDSQTDHNQRLADARQHDAQVNEAFTADPAVNRQQQLSEGCANSADPPAQFLPDAGTAPKGQTNTTQNFVSSADQSLAPTTSNDVSRGVPVIAAGASSQAVAQVRPQSGGGDLSLNLQGGHAKTIAGQGNESQGRAGVPSSEFQTLLDAADRTRQDLGMVRRPGLSGGTNSRAGRGVNLSQPGSINELARLVRTSVGPRHSSMVLRLDPPNMGQLRIDVQMHHQELSVRIEATTAAGQEMLQSRLNDLRAALEQQGVQVHQVDVELRTPSSMPTPGDQDQDQLASDTSSGDQASHAEQGGESAGNGERTAANESDNETGAAAITGDLPSVDGEETIEIKATAEPGVDLVI